MHLKYSKSVCIYCLLITQEILIKDILWKLTKLSLTSERKYYKGNAILYLRNHNQSFCLLKQRKVFDRDKYGYSYICTKYLRFPNAESFFAIWQRKNILKLENKCFISKNCCHKKGKKR